MKRFFTLVAIIILGLVLYQCSGGGGDGGGDSTIFTPPVILSGKLDTGSLTANAALSQTVVASLANIALAQSTVTDDISQ